MKDYKEITCKLQYELYIIRILELEQVANSVTTDEEKLLKQLVTDYNNKQGLNDLEFLIDNYTTLEIFELYEAGLINSYFLKKCLETKGV